MHAPTAARTLPTLRREGISWRVVRDRLVLELDFRNVSAEPTEEENLIVEAAPLGAFIPGKPVVRITLAEFDPGESRRVVSHIPLSELQFEQHDLPEVGVRSMDAMTPVMRSLRDARARGSRIQDWMGNFSIHFDRAPEATVEIHFAPGLEIPVGDQRMLVFKVAERNYRMTYRASDPEWQLEESDCVVCITPPARPGRSALVTALATRNRDGKSVPIEFEFVTVERNA